MPFAAAPIACSRIPKWIRRPVASSGVIVPRLLTCMPVLPVRSPDAVNRPGTTSTTAASTSSIAVRVATEAPNCHAGSFWSHPCRPAPEMHASYSSGFGRASHAARASCAARAGLAVPEQHVVGDEEVLRRETEDLLHLGDLVRAERAAVRGRGVLHLRRRIADVRTQHDQRRARLLRDARAQSGFERVEIVGDLAELRRRATRTPRSASGRRRCR